MKKAAIILAGGKGKRFQDSSGHWQDKSLALLRGKPLLVHAIESVCDIVDELIVCVNDEQRREAYGAVLKNHAVCEARIRIDEQFDGLGGPLVGIFTGLKAVEAELCLTLPGDMPMFQKPVAERMFEEAEAAAVAVPMWPNGRLETLTMTLQKLWAFEPALALCLLGRPRSDDLFRAAPFAKFLSTTQLSDIDPQLKSFVNINAMVDLERLEPRRSEGSVKEDICIQRDTASQKELHLVQQAAKVLQERKFGEAAELFTNCAQTLEVKDAFFWAAITLEKAGTSLSRAAKSDKKQAPPEAKAALIRAAELYGKEASELEKRKCHFLTLRAKNDQAWCKKQTLA